MLLRVLSFPIDDVTAVAGAQPAAKLPMVAAFVQQLYDSAGLRATAYCIKVYYLLTGRWGGPVLA